MRQVLMKLCFEELASMKYRMQYFNQHSVIPRLSENAKHLSLLSADPSVLEAVNPESFHSRDEDRTESPDASYFRN